jgi:molecular chaperone GrpE
VAKEEVVEEPQDMDVGPDEEIVETAENNDEDAAVDEVQDEVDDGVSELEKAQQEAEKAKDTMLRLAAEFENYKRRMERERSIALKYAEESLVKELLPAIDNLERAIEQGKESHNVEDLLAGVELTHKGLMAALEKFEVAPMESIGEPFDPNHHEALAMEESDDMDANSVLKEFQKGYKYKDRLIRPAKVVVAKKVAETK